MEKSKNTNSPMEQTSGSIFSRQWNAADGSGTDEVPLKNVSVTAILCAIAGAMSFTLYFSPYFCFVPGIALFLAIITLIRIKFAEGALLGKKATLIGISLAIIFSVAVPIHHEVYRLKLKQDAKKYFSYWCSAAAEGDFLRIKQLSHIPHFLKPDTPETTYWRQFFTDPDSHTELHRFLTHPLLLTLAALGDKATYSYYRTDMLKVDKESDHVIMTYAVTYPNQKNEKETFFIRINAIRTRDAKRKLGVWKGGDHVVGPLPVDGNGVPTDTKK